MRRYLKISLLLLIINSLFLLDVHALEDDQLDNTLETGFQVEQVFEDNQEDAPQVENSLFINNIMDLIPDQFDLDYTQEEAICLFDEEDNLEVATDLVNQIQEILDNNNISLEDLNMYFIVERLFYQEDNDYTIFQYNVNFYHNDEVYTKLITVTYSNTSDYNIDDQELVDNAFEDVEVLEVNNTYDFYTEEVVDEVELFDVLEERLPEVNYTFFFEETNEEEYDLSKIQNGYTYLFINKVFYHVFPTIMRYYYVMNVTNEISNQDIVYEVSDKLEELQVEIPKNDVEIIDCDVYSNNLETYHGNIEINELKKEEKENYQIIKGANATIEGDGQLLVGVDCLINKLIKIIIDGNVVEKSKYSINNNDIVISSNFLSTLSKKGHSLVVRFSDGDAKTKFTLKEKRVEPQYDEYRPYYPIYYDYHNYVDEKKDEVVQEVKQEVKKEENDEDKKSVLSPSDVVKNRKSSDDKVKEKEEANSRFNMNLIPIIIVILAFIFGGFGGYLYKKSLDD